MQVIRLSRVGKKKHAQYKIVLAERTYPVHGKFNEILGSYDPHLKQVNLKKERIAHWLGNGVQCTDTVYNLFVSQGMIEGKKRNLKVPRPEPKVEEPVAETPVEEEPKKEAKDEAAAKEAVETEAK
jgi:small subunit ribosomal protein S16